MAQKEDILEQIVEEYLTHKGYFVRHNVKYRPKTFNQTQSDIDVLVEFEPPIGLFKFLELEELLSKRLGGKVDLVSRKALKPEIGRSVLTEAVLA